jgi:hypothetical protein
LSSNQEVLWILIIGKFRNPVSIVVQILEMEGQLVHGVAVLVCLVKGAPGAGSFNVPEFVEDIVEKKGGRATFSIVDFPDDALAQKVEADL